VSTQSEFWRRWWAMLLALCAAALPFLALIPLGAVWLWQQGMVLWWLLSAAVLGAGGYGYARWLQRQVALSEAALKSLEQRTPVSPPDADWSPRDLAAWDKVQQLAADVNVHILSDHELLLDAARETIEVVALHYHPNLRDPVWRFTLPEALLLTERVSKRLREVLLQNVPGSHLIRAGQLRRIWELKPAAETGMRLFRGFARVYRIVRLLNPVGALLAEAREQLVAAALGETGSQLRRKGARIWVEEVGRAAIELYSGRLRLDADELRRHAEGDLARSGLAAAPPSGPLRLVVAGQTNAGKSSLVNALLGEVVAGVDVLPLTTDLTSYELQHEGTPEAVIVDTPGLDNEAAMARVVDAARDADCLIWLVAAHRPDRARDRIVLDTVRAQFAERPERIMPPIVVVVSHIDRLSPAREWAPPYDIAAPHRAKESAIRDAMETTAIDLEVPITDLVPARLSPVSDAYNVDLVWVMLAARFDAARRGRALRVLLSAPKRDWKRLLSQAGGAGRLVLGSLTR
jgi:uncharacterized protein